MQIKKRKKESRMHGKAMGTHGGGCRKNRKGSGHKGGKGLAGSGKRADHKKTLITKLYGHTYFGKKGITSKKTEKDKRERINLEKIKESLEIYLKKGIAKKTTKGIEIKLEKYKILGVGEIKEKLIIYAKEASKSAIEKIRKQGGEIILQEKKIKKDTDFKENKKEKADE